MKHVSGMFWSTSSFNGNISEWDMSNVAKMDRMFADAASFDADISKWDVSGVANMDDMLAGATSFNIDISNWDVSNVTNMDHMFERAALFNADISKWSVSGVTNMNQMFEGATSFKQRLCGFAWVHSSATKERIFGEPRSPYKDDPSKQPSSSSEKDLPEHLISSSEKDLSEHLSSSSGEGSSEQPVEDDLSGFSLSSRLLRSLTVCETTVFSPQSKEDLRSGIGGCLELPPTGDRYDGPDGPIWDWDVSKVTDTSFIFRDEISFSADISK